MASLPMFDKWGAEAPCWTVSDLTALIKESLETAFDDLALVGEVSGLKNHQSGHVYFKLKDESASINAVIWRNNARRLVFELENGMAVRVRGKLGVYAPRGEYSVHVDEIEPEGIGALELAFRQLFERLQAEGLFEPTRKRPLPRYPRRIVVVTSPTGAAVRDLLQVLRRRWPAAEVLIASTRVQGPEAAGEIAGAIALANRVENADVLILARGGGSLEDLWPFNEEVVARAIFGSRLPVVTAIGHEVDVTIADHVADLRALTPSEAGERCVPDIREVRAEVDQLAGRIARAGQARLDQGRLAVEGLAERAVCAVRNGIERREANLARLAAQLEALSPLGVLARGYSLTLQADGRAVVRSTDDVEAGSLIQTRLVRGTILSRVESLASTEETST